MNRRQRLHSAILSASVKARCRGKSFHLVAQEGRYCQYSLWQILTRTVSLFRVRQVATFLANGSHTIGDEATYFERQNIQLFFEER